VSQDKVVLIDLIEECTTHGKPVPLPLRLRYHSESSSESIHDIIGKRGGGIKEFYYRPRFVNEKSLLDTTVEYVFDGGHPQITGQAFAYFVHGVGNNGEAFIKRPEKSVRAAMDLAYCNFRISFIHGCKRLQADSFEDCPACGVLMG